MNISSDYEDLFKVLNAAEVKYLVAGSYAVSFYIEPRFTKDIDIWIIPEINDEQKVFGALKLFGAPLVHLKPQDFKNKKVIYQIGVAPVRIDILMDIPGVKFDSAWKNRKKVIFGQTPINILGLEDLISSKKKAGRPQDLMDLTGLLRLKKLKRHR